jgi:hypothetical protein
MTIESMDTQVVSKPSRHFIEQQQPVSEIPEIDPLGDRAAIDAADEATLTAKFEEYAEAAPILAEHHEWERIRFDETYAHYVKIFTSLETLESIKQTIEAIAPSFDLLEEFELIDLPADIARISAVVGKVALYGGGVAALGGLAKAGYQSYQASKAVAIAKGKPIGAARSPSIVAGAKTASRWKAVGAAGAVLTVGSAAVGIIATIENQKRRMEFLRDSVESYQNWYAATNQGILDMSAASKEMEDAINALLEALGFSTPEELEAFLGGAVEDAGELQGALKTATRMLCADPPLAAADVSTYTGLPLATVQRRAALIAQDPGICQVGG